MDNIPVCIRTRPLNDRERTHGEQECWQTTREKIVSHPSFGNAAYTFDRCFEPQCSTRLVYNDVAHGVILSAMGGYNGTVFCYGQTSSGKTYTMYGTEENPGIVRLAARDIYSIIQATPDREYLVCASMVEIYNETIRDLLGRRTARIREDFTGRISLDAEKKAVSNPDEVLATLQDGERQASRAATNMNDQSSRSHTIFRLYIESKARTPDDDGDEDVALQSELNLVDLAGSECAAMTGSEGSQRREGAFINKSLLALSTVIEKLSLASEKKPGAATQFINYRDSTLTRMLQSSLGGNSKTAIICNVSLAPSNFQQTCSTLQFASRAKKIRNAAKINEVTDDKTELKKCKREISELKRQLSLLNETNVQTIINEKDERVRDLQAERALMARKLEACMRMISVSNEPAQLAVKPEPFNRRFTLACPTSGSWAFRLSPLDKPLPQASEAPGWLGACRRSSDQTPSSSSSSSAPPSRAEEVSSAATEAANDGSEDDPRPAKKRKCGLDLPPVQCLEVATQTESEPAVTGRRLSALHDRVLELENQLEEAADRSRRLEAAGANEQWLREQAVERMTQEAADAQERHRQQVAALEAEHAAAVARSSDQLQAVRRQLAESEEQLAASRQDVATLETLRQQLDGCTKALAARDAEVGVLTAQHTEGQRQVAALASELETTRGALRRMEQAALEDGREAELEAQVAQLQAAAEDHRRAAAEQLATLRQQDDELRNLRAQEADLQAQLAIGAIGGFDEPTEVGDMRGHLQRLEAEAQGNDRQLLECQATIASLTQELREKDAAIEAHRQAASQQTGLLDSLTERLQAHEATAAQKGAELAGVTAQLRSRADDAQALQARVAELTAEAQERARALAHAQTEAAALRAEAGQSATEWEQHASAAAAERRRLQEQLEEATARLREIQTAGADGALDATASQQLAGSEAENLELRQRIARAQGLLEEQEITTSGRVQELEEQLALAAAAQEAHQGELQWWRDQLAQKEAQLAALQEETEGLRLQHGHVLQQMAGVAPGVAAARKVPVDRLRDDNVALQKQLTALKNELLLKDRKVKAYEKVTEGRSKEVDKCQARLKAAEEMLKQLRQEKGGLVQEIVKKEAEVKETRRKLERLEREEEKYAGHLRAERERVREVQEQLQGNQAALQTALVERNERRDAAEAAANQLQAARDAVVVLEKKNSEQEVRLQALQESERALDGHLVEMAALNEKAAADLRAARQHGEVLATQLQACEERLVRHEMDSKRTLETLAATCEDQRQQLADLHELQELSRRERAEVDEALQQRSAEARRGEHAAQVLEERLRERDAELEVLQGALQDAEAALQAERVATQAQREELEARRMALAKADCDLRAAQVAAATQRAEARAMEEAHEALRQQSAKLEHEHQVAAAQLAELREQQQETEEELRRATQRAMELETDRDTLQVESDTMRREMDATAEKLHAATTQSTQLVEEARRTKEALEERVTELEGEVATTGHNLRDASLELAEKRKAIMMLEGEVRRQQSEWTADMEKYAREFAEKERQVAKAVAESTFLTEEVTNLQNAVQQKTHELEEAAIKREDAARMHAQQVTALQEQVEEAQRQRSLAAAKSERDLEAVRAVAGRVPELEGELQETQDRLLEAQGEVDRLQGTAQALQETLQAKEAELSLADTVAGELRGELTDWRLRLDQKTEALAEAEARLQSLSTALKAAGDSAARRDVVSGGYERQVAELRAQLAASEELVARRERAAQAAQQELLELKRERHAAQVTLAQRDGELEGVKTQLRRIADHSRQLEAAVAQKDIDMETLKTQHATEVQQTTRSLSDLQAGMESAQKVAAGKEEALSQATSRIEELEMALASDRRAHQQKVRQLEELVEIVKRQVAQTEQASQSERVAHRRQTMAISTNETQLRRLQTEKDELEAELERAREAMAAAAAQATMAAQAQQQLREKEEEWQEEREFLAQRVLSFQDTVTFAKDAEDSLRARINKLQDDLSKQRARHEKAVKKLKEDADTRYRLLKEKAIDRLDRAKRESMARRSVVKVEEESLNLAEGERRVPRRSSIARVPFTDRTNLEAPRTGSESESDPELAAGPSEEGGQVRLSTSRRVHWAAGPTTSKGAAEAC